MLSAKVTIKFFSLFFLPTLRRVCEITQQLRPHHSVLEDLPEVVVQVIHLVVFRRQNSSEGVQVCNMHENSLQARQGKWIMNGIY